MAESPEGFRQEVKYIPLSQLDTSPRYQRERKTGSLAKQVRKIADNFRPEKFQIPDVYEKNGHDLYPVADGKGRILALELLGFHGTHCRVIPKASERKQSETFISLQKDRLRVSALDEFVAQMSDPEVQSIKTLLRETGYAVVDESNQRESYPRLSGGVEVMRAIFRIPRANLLRRSLVLAKHWAGKGRVNGLMLHTVALLLANQSASDEKLLPTLQRVSMSEAAKQVSSMVGKVKTRFLPAHIAKVIAKKHNKGRNKYRIDEDRIDQAQSEFLKYLRH